MRQCQPHGTIQPDATMPTQWNPSTRCKTQLNPSTRCDHANPERHYNTIFIPFVIRNLQITLPIELKGAKPTTHITILLRMCCEDCAIYDSAPEQLHFIYSRIMINKDRANRIA